MAKKKLEKKPEKKETPKKKAKEPEVPVQTVNAKEIVSGSVIVQGNTAHYVLYTKAGEKLEGDVNLKSDAVDFAISG